MKLTEQEVRLGRAIGSLLETGVREELLGLRQDVVEDLVRAEDFEARERAWHDVRAMDRLIGRLETLAETGKLADSPPAR